MMIIYNNSGSFNQMITSLDREWLISNTQMMKKLTYKTVMKMKYPLMKRLSLKKSMKMANNLESRVTQAKIIRIKET